MSTDEHTPLADDAATVHAMTVRQSALLEHQEMGWINGAALAEPPQPPGLDLSGYLHALRRHWILATALGATCAMVAGMSVWMYFAFWGKNYQASTLLQVAAQSPTLAFRERTGMARQADFEIYKDTQLGMVKSPFVLLAALVGEVQIEEVRNRYERIAELPSVAREADQVAWLSEELSVGFQGEGEMMRVSLMGNDPGEAAALVEAVVSAYMTDIVEKEKSQRANRLSQLDRVYSERATALRATREKLKTTADSLGTPDQETASVTQQLAMKEYYERRNELTGTKSQLRIARGKLVAKQALLASIENAEITTFAVDRLGMTDPIYRELGQQLTYLGMNRDTAQMYLITGSSSQVANKAQTEYQMVQQDFEERGRQLREGLKAEKVAEVMGQITEFEAQVEVLKKTEEELAADVKETKENAERIGKSSTDLEMMRSDIKQQETLLTGLGEQRDQLQVEIKAAGRVRRMDQLTRVPEYPVNTPVRIALTILASVAGLCIPALCIMWWDTRSQRVNSSAELSKKIGLPVIGSVPMIPAGVIRRLGSPSKRNQSWRMRLTESTDSVAARLLRKAELEGTRVVLVTSATGGEGKTTLATQLAMSLARNGRRTLLVDFDLRRPSFDEVFGLPRAPGASEALRGESDVPELIHQTGTENLSVVTAGRWNRQALAALANGGAGPIFEKLRAEHDFVIVDASPILPVADTRFISQHVDTVILSVFRDVSQMPKVQAACEILEAFGVRTLEAVVTGPSESLRDKDLEYESSSPA